MQWRNTGSEEGLNKWPGHSPSQILGSLESFKWQGHDMLYINFKSRGHRSFCLKRSLGRVQTEVFLDASVLEQWEFTAKVQENYSCCLGKKGWSVKSFTVENCWVFGMICWNRLVVLWVWGSFLSFPHIRLYLPQGQGCICFSYHSTPCSENTIWYIGGTQQDLLTTWFIIININWWLIMYLILTYMPPSFSVCQGQREKRMKTQIHVVMPSWASTQDFCLLSLQWIGGRRKTLLPSQPLMGGCAPCMVGSRKYSSWHLP